MMISFNVSKHHPLTSSVNAIQVWRVTDLDFNDCGTFVSPERALQYVLDWIHTAHPEQPVSMYHKDDNEHIILVNEELAYRVQPSDFRF